MKKAEQKNYFVTGVFLLAGAVFIAVAVVFSGKLGTVLTGGYPLYITYNYLDGLTEGSRVRMGGGVDVGIVRSIGFDESNKIRVRIYMDRKIQVSRGATFEIVSSSLVGGKHIEIKDYDMYAEDVYEPEEVITGKDPVSLGQFVSDLGDSFGGKDGITSDIQHIATVTRLILEENQLDVRVTIRKLRTTMAQIDKIVQAVDPEQVQSIMDNLDRLAILLGKFDTDDSTIDLLIEPSFRKDVELTMSNIQVLTAILRDKPNALFVGGTYKQPKK